MNKNKSNFISELESIVELFESGKTLDVFRFKKFVEITQNLIREHRNTIKLLEWNSTDSDGDEYCSICENYKKDGHLDDCPVRTLFEKV